MKNNYKIIGDVVEIELRDGERCLIDLDDLNKVDAHLQGKYSWYMCKTSGYIKGGSPITSLHRLVMDTSKGLVVDHINHLKWDNRKSNLRNCTASENSKNQFTHAELIRIGAKEAPKTIEQLGIEKYLTNQDVMKLLGVKRQTLHVYREKKGLPYIKLNSRTFRYEKANVLKWLSEQNK